MRRGRKKGANKEKVFGCDLLEHLTACSQEIPPVLRSCSEFIEEHGVVDGIYRLSGVSSNIQKLRSEFDSDSSPDLHKDLYLQDIHCVSSLCKAYFRELPNPLLTYQLYDKFAEAVAIQLEEERLVKIKDVLKELPLPHYRTLEFLMCHLVKMASYSSETNMHARNLAIVWAPNLLRSKDIETSGFNGTAAFMEVRVQSIVVEFILTHGPQLFPEQAGVQAARRKSLPPSPTAVSSLEEPLLRHHASVQCTNSYGNISPGDGPLAMRSYHSIIENTEKRKGSLKGRKWMSIFNIGGRFHDQRRRNKHSTKEKSSTSLRPARSMDCLISPSCTNDDGSRHPAQRPPSTHLSPLAVPSPQLGSEVTPGGLGGSGYAVTYRRGTGVVSGGSGTQGTYNLLDPKGAGTTGATEGQPHQSRSPGMSSKTGRRAAMHITGPQYVTVPLHITSNLAMMLQGGGGTVIHYGREKDRGGDRADRKEGGEKVQLKAAGGEMEQGKEDGRADVKVEDMKGDEQNGQTVRQEEEEAETERGREEKCSADEEVKGVEETEVGVKEKRDEEVEREECLSEPPQEEGADSREKEQGSEDHNSSMEENGDDDDDNDEDTEDEEDDEYMEMKACQHIATAPESPESPVSEAGVCGDDDSGSDLSHILNSTEVEDDVQELSGYVQDNFNFLDDMDCSVSNQINEFSVEAPFYENEYEFMEVPRPPPPPSTETAQRPRAETAPQIEAQIPTPVRSHRPLSADACHRHTKSLSLPFMSPPFFPVAMSSEDDDEEEEDDDDDDDEDDMFYKSLPANYSLLSNLTWSAPGANGEDPSSPPQTALEPQSVIVNTIHVGESQSSEPTPLDSECATHNELNVERMEQGELNDQEEPEQRSQLKGGDDLEEEEEDPESEMLIQNTATEEIHNLVDTGVTEESGAPCDKPFTSESLAACHEGFPTPRTEDNDETNNLACMQIIDEAQNMALNSHPISETVSYSMQEETVDLSAEILEDSSESVPELHKIDVTTDREEVREREGNTVEEGINTVEGMNMVQNQAQEEQEISLVLRKGSQSSDLKITESDEEKLEGDDALGNHDIWSESEDIICEEYDKSKHGEEKDTGEDVCNVKEGDEQTGQEHEEVVQEAGKGTTVSEEERKEKDDVEPFKAEVTTDMVMEEGTGLSLVEGLPSEDQETVPDVQSKEIDSPLVERGIDLPPETYATQEEEMPQKHEQDEDDGNSSEQEIQSEQKATNEEQPQALMVVGEKEKTQSEVNTEGTGVPGEGKSEDEEMESRPRSEAGVGGTLMISKQTCKVYHSRTVPVVPPKPQHCRLTALSLRQQQDRWDANRERESSSRAAVAEHKERDADEAGTGGQDKVCTGEQGAYGEGHEESMRGRKERPALKAGGKESEKRRDGDDGPTPRHGPSMCFDEAVAMATMRRERERKRYSGHEVQ